MPSKAQADDYRKIVEATKKDRPAVVWVSNMVKHCWPEESEKARLRSIKREKEKLELLDG